MGAVVLTWAISTGKFDGFIPDLSNFKGIQLQPPGSFGGSGGQANIMQQYPDPYQLKLAVERGEVDINSLPQAVKDMVNNAKPPELTPTP